MILSEIELIEPEENRVRIAKDGRILHYDYLIIATGTSPRPEETPGLTESEWRHTITTFTPTKAQWPWPNIYEPGKVVNWFVSIMELPTNAPLPPLEFIFLADWYFHQRNMRDRVELTLVTPLPGAFTKPRAAGLLGNILEEKKHPHRQ